MTQAQKQDESEGDDKNNDDNDGVDDGRRCRGNKLYEFFWSLVLFSGIIG